MVILRKRAVSTEFGMIRLKFTPKKFLHQEIRSNYCILRNVTFLHLLRAISNVSHFFRYHLSITFGQNLKFGRSICLEL